MSNRTQTPKRIHYKQDYVSYWNSKGEYGKNRVVRMLQRIDARYYKMQEKRNHRFRCEMGYAGCEQRGYCNGDC